MNKIININNDNYKDVLNKLYLYGKSKKIFKFNYDDNFKYKDDFNNIEKALNIKDYKERLSFIYDVVCDYLDNLFINQNMCEFKDNKCYSNRCKNFDKINGCCANNKNVNCKYFDKDHCTIKCSGCKFYICPNLKKKRGPIKMNDIFITKLLSPRQKIVLRYTVFTPKEIIINKMLKFRL
jgi:hypothetical protein